MSADEFDSPNWSRMTLRVTTDGDPSSLTRVLGYFHNLNITPNRVLAEFASNELLHLQIDVTGVSEKRLTLIAAKAAQIPCVLKAFWHR
jgi:hypothetical protein